MPFGTGYTSPPADFLTVKARQFDDAWGAALETLGNTDAHRLDPWKFLRNPQLAMQAMKIGIN